MRQSGVRGDAASDGIADRGAGDPGDDTLTLGGGGGTRDTAARGDTVSEMHESGASAKKPKAKRSLGARIVRWFTGLLAFAVLLVAGAGFLYYEHLNGNIRTDPLNLGDHKAPSPTPNAAGQTPLNILLIGSDGRDTKEDQDLGGARNTFGGAARADVEMLVHLSADRTNMSVLSMPRDTLVQIPQCTDPKTGKVYPATTGTTLINESLGHGGPGCTVATWEQLTGIHIDHFMMVDFAGVVSMADAIGGVPVCVDANIYSHTSSGHGSGLKLTKGTHYVKGVQALQWLRTRYGFEDGSDIARTKAQHQYMSAMERQLRQNATLSNPGKLRSLAEEATKALQVDEGLDTVKKLYDLSNELKKVPPDRITSTTMPFEYVGSHVRPKPVAADEVFRLIRDDKPLDGKSSSGTSTATASPSPTPTATGASAAPDSEIAVQVRNGTRTATLAPASGRASSVAAQLVAKGFTHAVADPTTVLAEPKTLVQYPSADLQGDAERVAKVLGIPDTQVVRTTAVSGVTLVVGADWREPGSAYPGSSSTDDTDPSKALDPNTTVNGADTHECMHVDPAYTW
jgi:LCP family protein required for cell wall assembly